MLEQVLASGEHQERLIDALLVLSRSQRGLDRRETVDLAAVAAQTLERVDANGLTVERSLAPALHRRRPAASSNAWPPTSLNNAVQHNQPPAGST